MNQKIEWHRMHIKIPEDLHIRLVKIIPEQGLISSIVRRFLYKYVDNMEKAGISKIDDHANIISKNDIIRNKEI